MKRIISFILCALIIGTVVAQQPKNLQRINSTDFIKNGINYHDEGKYQEALAEYAKVPFGDEFYDLALYEKALTMEVTGDYRGAIQNINELLDNPSCQINRNKMYMVLGDCYDYLEQYDKAVEAYDQALQIAPYDYLTLFNKGVSLMNNEKYEEALECFKKSIFIAPAHQGSHYRYGLCCLNLGYTVPGILALNFSTLINTSSKYCLQALQILDNLYNQGVSTFNNENDIDINDDYEELNLFYKDIHQLLNSKAVETQKFHSLTKVNHNIAKYNQLVFSNVKVRPDSRAIEDMLYVPYFKQVLDKNQFNTLCYYQFSETDVDNNKVAKKAQKMRKEFDLLIEDIILLLQDKASLGLGIENKDNISYIYSDHLKLTNWGKYNPMFKDKQMQEGEWTALNDNGQIADISNFKMDNLHGLSRVYHNGEVVQESTWNEGKPEGHVILYTADPIFHQRIVSEEFDIRNGEYEGAYSSYSEQGILQKEGTLVKSEFEGVVKYYDAQGHLTELNNDSKGKAYGQQKSYYPGGQLKGEYRAGNPDEQTEYRLFYIDGNKKQEGFIKNEKQVGQWISYLPSGQIDQKEQYDDDGELHGEKIQYHSNGNINAKVNYDHGKHVKHVSFGKLKGLPICTYLFDNGKLTSITSHMPDGSVRQEYTVKNKTVTFDLYSEHGYKRMTGTIDVDFQWQGPNTLYYHNGQIAEENMLKDDQFDGISKSYYPNGRLQKYCEYKDGKINGIYMTYYDNKDNSIASEYIVKNDTIVGAYYEYYPDGSIKSINYNDENGNDIYSCIYNPDKTKIKEIKYYHGVPCYVSHYNRSNEVIARDTLVNGTGVLHDYFPEGQLMATTPYVAGLSEGTDYIYNLDGSVLDSAVYVSGKINDFDRTFFPTGNIRMEAKSVMGDYHGKLTYYYPTGKTRQEQTIEYGKIVSFVRFHNDGKSLRAEGTYTNGERTGKTSYYAPDGKTLLYELYFENEMEVKIACAQKGGQMSEPMTIDKGDQTFKAYYPNGTVGAVISYSNGLINDVKSLYYPNGQACETTPFVNDQINGSAICYYANGQIQSKEEYKDGMLHGEEIWYYPNGQIQYEGHYYYDLPHGAFYTYDKDGKKTHKVIMYYGHTIIDERY